MSLQAAVQQQQYITMSTASAHRRCEYSSDKVPQAIHYTQSHDSSNSAVPLMVVFSIDMKLSIYQLDVCTMSHFSSSSTLHNLSQVGSATVLCYLPLVVVLSLMAWSTATVPCLTKQVFCTVCTHRVLRKTCLFGCTQHARPQCACAVISHNQFYTACVCFKCVSAAAAAAAALISL
jgi:hypothetical protein